MKKQKLPIIKIHIKGKQMPIIAEADNLQLVYDIYDRLNEKDAFVKFGPWMINKNEISYIELIKV